MDDTAIRRVCAKHLHECFWVPRTDSHERLRVSYSTTSNFDNDELPVALYAGPMFGNRYFALDIDNMATTMGVRVILIDRPGMGGSSPVPLNQRISVWIETVPLLLQRLNIKHVAIFSHSAGTIYALNTLDRLRSILDPENPLVALVGPFIDSTESQAVLMKIVQQIPDGLLGSWDKVARFMITKVSPATVWSGGIFTSVSSLFNTASITKDETTLGEKFGVEEQLGKAIDKYQWKFSLAESLAGGNDEARLCRKKNEAASWEACDDYKSFVKTLAQREKPSQSKDGSARLKVRVFYAENDIMSGSGGQDYFESCWNQEGVDDAIDFKSVTMQGTNHDSAILDLKKGALKGIFNEMKRNT